MSLHNQENIIELRSEKARNIIGQIPPFIVRLGITVFLLIIISFFLFSYFLEYTPILKTTAIIKNENGKNIALLKIPANNLNKIKIGSQVSININNIPNLGNFMFQDRIKSISNNLMLKSDEAYYIAELSQIDTVFLSNQIIPLEEITVNAEITLDKISIFNKFFYSLF